MAARFVLPRLAGRLSATLRTLTLVAVIALVAAPAATAAAPATNGPDFAAIDRHVREQLDGARVPGGALGIVQGDRIAHLAGFGVADATGRAVTPQTPFMIGSVTKSFTALAIMQLVEAGRLDLDAPVQRYLPWFRLANADYAARITVRHLLNQTSGIPTSAGLWPLSGPVTTLEAQVRALASVAPDSEPGARYAYSNANYAVLGLVVETVAGEPYGQYVQGHIFDPLAMRHSHADSATAAGDGLADGHRLFFGRQLAEHPAYRADLLPAGYLSASAEDLTHYLIAQLNGGEYAGATVLSGGGIAELHQPAAKVPGPIGTAAYGMGWITATVNGIEAIEHNGSTGDMHAMVLLEPRGRWGVVLLCNATGTLTELTQQLDAIAWGVLALLTGHQPGGALANLYLAFDLFVAALTLLQLRALVRLLRGQPDKRSRFALLVRLRESLPARLWVWYTQLILPILLVVGLPRYFSTPWRNLVRADIGLWLLVFALLQFARGAVRLARLPAVRATWRNLAPARRPALASGE